MFIVLAPVALFGLGLLIVPVLLHLFKPRKVRVVPFSSLRWLRDTQLRLSRRIKWHQIVLFLLRASFITLLVLALARPIFSSSRSGKTAERFIILDTSGSMNYKSPTGSNPIEFGKELAQKLILKGLAGDRSTVILAGSDAVALGPLVGDPSIYLPSLRAVRAGSGGGDLTVALKLVWPMLCPRRPNATVELFFITDNYSQSWSQNGVAKFLEEMEMPVRVHVVDVGPERPQNAWIANAQFSETERPWRRVIRVEVGGVGDQVQKRTVRLSRITGLPELTQDVEVEAGRVVSVEFEIPPALELGGKVAQINLEPADALPADDTYWLNLELRENMRVLVIEPESTQVKELQPGFHLRTALEALSFADKGSLQVVRRSETSVKTSDISESDVIMLVDVPSLSDEALVALQERVESGAGLAVFLGPLIDREFYNTKLHNPLRPSHSLLPVEVGECVEPVKDGGELVFMTEIQWNHPLLSQLFDPMFGDLAQTSFRRYYALGPVQPGDGIRIVAFINHKAPAILESELGAGKALVFNTTANDAWSDLPRRKSYVPLVDRVLSHLAGGLRRGMFEVGDAIILPLSHADDDTAVAVTTPSGQKIKPALRTVAGRTVMQLDAVQEAGIYHVEYSTDSGKESFPFVVQVGHRECALAPMNEGTLRRWWEPAEFEKIVPTSGSGRVPVTENRITLDPLLMVIAFLVLLAEMLLVHQLCPKAHPRIVSDSLVSKQGFFAPGNDRNRESP